MTKYFYLKDNEKIGPLSTEDLSTADLNKDTLVWFQGLEDWTPMSEIEELKSVLEIKPPPIPIVPPPVSEVKLNLETSKDIPPPLSNQNNPESTSFSKPLKFFLIIIVVFIASAIGTSLGTWSFESNEKTAQKKINEQDDANQFYKDQSIKESEVQKPKEKVVNKSTLKKNININKKDLKFSFSIPDGYMKMYPKSENTIIYFEKQEYLGNKIWLQSVLLQTFPIEDFPILININEVDFRKMLKVDFKNLSVKYYELEGNMGYLEKHVADNMAVLVLSTIMGNKLLKFGIAKNYTKGENQGLMENEVRLFFNIIESIKFNKQLNSYSELIDKSRQESKEDLIKYFTDY
jgi:hypothetical protein